MDVQHQEYGESVLMSSILDTIDKVRCPAIGHDRDAGLMAPPDESYWHSSNPRRAFRKAKQLRDGHGGVHHLSS